MTYTETQLNKVAPFSTDENYKHFNLNGQFSLKIHSKNGETNWLDITLDQFREIEKLLSQGE